MEKYKAKWSERASSMCSCLKPCLVPIYRFVTMRCRTHMVFVYGTLQKGQANHFLLEDKERGWAEFVGRAETVQNWPLVVATQFDIPFLLCAPGRGRIVTGDLYQIDDKMLHFLDEVEGHPNMYVRQEITVRVMSDVTDNSANQGEEVTCYCYVLKRFKPEMLSLPYQTRFQPDPERKLVYNDERGKQNLEDVLREEVWT